MIFCEVKKLSLHNEQPVQDSSQDWGAETLPMVYSSPGEERIAEILAITKKAYDLE